MARDRALLNLAIWQDADFRALPVPAQHLYFVLWTHPGLSYAGVVDWRPGRIAAMAGDWTAADVETAAACLEHRLFIVVDHDTEEALVRSFVRFDGLMKQANLGVSFALAYAAVASAEVRGVIVHEAHKLHAREPGLPSWTRAQVRDVLAQPAVDPRSRSLPNDPFAPSATPPLTPGLTPTATPGLTPAVTQAPAEPDPPSDPGGDTPPTTATTTATSYFYGTTSRDDLPDAPADAGARPTKAKPKSRGTRIPEPFTVTPAMVEWARRETPGLDHRAVTARFEDYWRAVPGAKGLKLDWTATWRNWLRREHDTIGARPGTDRPRAGSSVWGNVVRADSEATP